jgi:hypothetical protein
MATRNTKSNGYAVAVDAIRDAIKAKAQGLEG